MSLIFIKIKHIIKKSLHGLSFLSNTQTKREKRRDIADEESPSFSTASSPHHRERPASLKLRIYLKSPLDWRRLAKLDRLSPSTAAHPPPHCQDWVRSASLSIWFHQWLSWTVKQSPSPPLLLLLLPLADGTMMCSWALEVKIPAKVLLFTSYTSCTLMIIASPSSNLAVFEKNKHTLIFSEILLYSKWFVSI